MRQPAGAATRDRLSSAQAVRAVAGRIVDALPRQVSTRVRRAAGRPGVRIVSLDDLDAEFASVSALFARAPEEARLHLERMAVATPPGVPTNPFSEGYAEWTWDLYRRISGRDHYTADNEGSPFDLAAAIACPYPYQTGSARLVGRDLLARGHLMATMAEVLAGSSPARIVEFGPGWGNLTSDLVAIGAEVTAVELDEKFCALLKERCTGRPGALTVEHTDMLSFSTAQPFDAAVFFESFHHCADHLAMLQRLRDIVRPGGVVFFASEPVHRMPFPWGPRLDGLSVWSSRTYGWLELGFDDAYFTQALARTGWRGRRVQIGRRPAETDVIVATRT
jgi:SAM-dependent methyltransferase